MHSNRRNGDTIDYEKLFAWEYGYSISNQCTAETSTVVLLTIGLIDDERYGGSLARDIMNLDDVD